MVYHSHPQHSGSFSLIVNSDSSPQGGHATQQGNLGGLISYQDGSQLLFQDGTKAEYN